MGKGSSDNRDRYRNAMKDHGFGYALYEPEQFDRIKPGTLGYFDANRMWHNLLDLTDAPSLRAANLTPFVEPHRRVPDKRRWGPLTSNHVSERNVQLGAGVDGTSFGLPASVSIVTEYSTKGGFGAVLMCDNDVVVEGYDVRGPIERWIRENRLALAKILDLKEHGVVCSTWTYSSENVHLNVWEDSETKVVVGVGADVQGLANTNASTSWLRGRSGSKWTDWPTGKRVVFFSGVKCEFNWLGRMTTKPESQWRGGNSSIVWDAESNDAYECEIQSFPLDFDQANIEGTDSEDEEEKP
ncbi:hypothetical protein BR93DRAFT_885494 [Coniochaeta sp. PMI_546]|nr:hypothetical protein BR93DRAFT_885494 [Coniochaeta sp. PMI_546]